MATAYAALLSLINTIALERASGPLHSPIPFDTSLIDALLERVDFLVEFLEQGWKGAEHLDDRITDLAYAAEDAIESPIVDLMHSRLPASSNNKGPFLAVQDLGAIIEDLDSIKIEMMSIKDKSASKGVQHGGSSGFVLGSSSDAPRGEKNKMVGFEEEMLRIMEELEGAESGRQLISIVGMGGIGKTTLARTVYDHQRIIEYFDVRAWVTVSQDYGSKEMFEEVLSCPKIHGSDEMDEDLLGETVYKSLCGRRYLVVFDDIWDIDAWHRIRRFFPDNFNGSRIILTTRLFNLANEVSNCSFGMKCLDDDNSWKLLSETVFGQGRCPLELEEVGKKISRNCRGLPLTIVVIGGLLAKSNLTLEYWKGVEEDFSSYLSDADHCSKILSLSYSNLPIHLKPCFLYIGIFPEDHKISVTELSNLWIAEGFLKSYDGKVFEEIAEEYLMDLIERNLVMVSEREFGGKVKCCIIHDLLRDVCTKEGCKDGFFTVVTQNSPSVPLSWRCQRRIVVRQNKTEMMLGIAHLTKHCLPSTSGVRSLILNFHVPFLKFFGPHKFRLLRILFVVNDMYTKDSIGEAPSDYVNLRYFTCASNSFSTVPLFRNMHVLTLSGMPHGATPKINLWNWPHVRHVEFTFSTHLEVPSGPLGNYMVLEKLQTIEGPLIFQFDEAICSRIPNVKKLRLTYFKSICEFMMHNLARLQNLESVNFTFYNYNPEYCCTEHGLYRHLRIISFPHSLKDLNVHHCKGSWEDMTVVGSLPNLEALSLNQCYFAEQDWNPVEGEFLQLKSLQIRLMKNLACWNADQTHFPVLQKLILCGLDKLKEIPLDIGEIPTLQSIELVYCRTSLVMSVKNMIDEQLSFGNNTLRVEAFCYKSSLLDGLEAENFHFQQMSIDESSSGGK